MRLFDLRTAVAAAGICAALAAGAEAATVTFTTITSDFNSGIGIDTHEPTNSLVMSVNYSGGMPRNFERVQSDGTHAAWSTVSGLTDEVKIATARAVSGSFAPGTMFSGTGTPGEILRVSPDGTTSGVFVTLPGAPGLMRGSLYVDRTGEFGGDLIAVTTTGQVWRIDTSGVATMLAATGVHLEGVITVPNDPSTYGPMAGTIIAGAEGYAGRMYIIPPGGGYTFVTLPGGVRIEDIDLITPNENFYGVNYSTGRLLGAVAADFASNVGDILLTQEFPYGGTTGLSTLSWSAGGGLAVAPVAFGGGFTPGQWEHVTFSTAGISEISTTLPEPGSAAFFGLGAALVALRSRRRRG